MTPQLQWNSIDIHSQDVLNKACWKRVEEFTGNPLLIDFIAKLIKKWNIPERDNEALARAIQVYAQKYIKFFRENPERFASPIRTILWGIGDCDDKSIFIATVLRSFRIPTRLRFIEYISPKTKTKKAHVFPEAFLNGVWVALESVQKWPLGKNPISELQARNIKVKATYIGDTEHA